MKKFILVLFLLSYSSVFAQQGWYFLNPTPTGNNLSDIEMFNESTGICLGSKEVMRTTDGGNNWSRITSPWNSNNKSMCMVDSLIGYMGIDSNTIVKTTNGGVNWYHNSSIKKSYINKVYFLTEKMGFALQYYGYYPYYNSISKIFRTTNEGVKWDSVAHNQNINLQFKNIYFSSVNTGFILGTTNIGNNINRNILLRTTNGGLHWDSISNPLNYSFNTFFFLNENTGFSGGPGTLKTTNGGLTWAILSFIVSNPIYIKFFNANTGFSFSHNIFTKTTNGGINWSYYNSGVSIANFDMVNENFGVGTGGTGNLFKTTNGGLNWNNYFKSSFSYDFWEVRFSDENTGYAIPKNDKILKTTNAGLNWIEMTSGSDRICSIANVNGEICYAAESSYGRIHKTTNGGINWTILPINASIIFTIKFLNENTGFGVCKYGKFFKTIDGGMTWFYKDSLQNIESGAIDFIDENTGMIGGIRLYKTTNGGMNWEEIIIGKRVNDIKFVTDKIVFLITNSNYNGYEYPAYILKSTDGGNKWDSTRISASWPNTIQFPEQNTGYVQGNDRMYKTTNQGVNWFEINSGYAYGLQSFDWINALTGYSVGNEGAILKTTDGGGAPSTIPSIPEVIPEKFSLYQNYPNPVNPSTKIKFDLPSNGNQTNIPVKIIIFDILGRKLETLLDENLSAGVHEVNWNASKYAAGVYFYMLLTDGIKETKKMILIK